jgi:hypothetical protein
MIFETKQDLERETKAIKKFCSIYNLTYKKLDPFDIDFMIFNKNSEHIGFAEVKGRHNKNVADVKFLTLSLSKACKLQAKRLNPIVIWSLDDGIIYSKLNNLVGTVSYGGRDKRAGSYNDTELVIRYSIQKAMSHAEY